MAMSTAAGKTPVAEGSVFLIPLSNELLGACRVVRQERLGWIVVLIDGFWPSAPELAEILARPALICGQHEARTVAGTPPKAFLCAGHAPLRFTETQVIVPPTPFKKWETLARELAAEHARRNKLARVAQQKSK